MKSSFTKECLSISLSRNSDNDIKMYVSSDYAYSNRKDRLFVNEKSLCEKIERFWKSISTKKLMRMSVSFGEIDYYDDMTDMYETPVVTIQRGLKKAKISENSHGCIPKEWSIDVTFTIKDTTTKTPIIEILTTLLGTYIFNSEIEKKFTKDIKPFLQKKTKYCSYSE